MPNVYAVNRTSYSISVNSWDIYYINNSNAELITVYNSNNNPYDCFKYILNNTPWFYVLDGIQNSWVNDLSNIGYSLTPAPVLPTVVLLGKAEYDYWLYVGATTANKILSSGSNCPLYSDLGSSSYGWTTYPKAVISCQKYEYSEYWNVAKGRTGLSLVMSTLSGVQWPGCQNDLNESITFIRIKAAYCRDDSATVITVYNSSNVAYNAFKYTTNGTDYYYVLDGTQIDWVTDLSSIGYQLYQEITLYIPGGSSNTYYYQTNVTSSYTGSPNSANLYPMYTDSSCTTRLAYDNTKRYEQGWYNNGVWTLYTVNSLLDMPATTTSSSDHVSGEIIQKDSNNKVCSWFVTNKTSSVFSNYSVNPVEIKVRLYPL